MKKFYKISDLARILGLVNPATNRPLNHVLRYWETEFKEIKPKKINKIRYYSAEQLEIIKKINFLLKKEGMTISGAKKLLDKNINKLDVDNNISLKTEYYKKNLKIKSNKILEKINKLKNYGKKNSS